MSPSSLELAGTLSPSTLSGSPAWSATFSIDGKYLAVCFGNPATHVKIWEHIITTTPQHDCKGASSQTSCSNNTDSNGSKKEEKEAQDIITNQWRLISTIREEHTRTIRSVAFAPTSSTISVPILATASFDGKVLIWECYPDNNNATSSITTMSTADTKSNISEEDTEIINLFEPIAQLEGHENEIKCLAWNATGSLLASCGRDKTIWIWECFLPGTVGGADATPMHHHDEPGNDDNGEFECLAVLQGHDGDVKSIVFGPSHSQWGEGDEVLYSASYDNTIKVWAEESGDWYCAMTLKEDVHMSTVWSLGLTPGGVRLFSGSDDGSLGVWKMYTALERKKLFPREGAVSSTDGLWKCVGKLPDAHSSYAILSIDCAPSRVGHGRVVSGGGDNCINIYREETTTPAISGGDGEGKAATLDAPKFTIEAIADDAHDGDVNCVKWHPRDGTCLVSCGDDGAVKLWRYKR